MTDPEHIATTVGHWAASQPWWRLAEAASQLSVRIVVFVPRFPDPIHGMGAAAVFVQYRGGTRVMVEEDVLVTSWYMTIADNACGPVPDYEAAEPVGEA